MRQKIINSAQRHSEHTTVLRWLPRTRRVARCGGLSYRTHAAKTRRKGNGLSMAVSLLSAVREAECQLIIKERETWRFIVMPRHCWLGSTSNSALTLLLFRVRELFSGSGMCLPAALNFKAAVAVGTAQNVPLNWQKRGVRSRVAVRGLLLWKSFCC